MTTAAAARAADLERYARIGGPPLEEAFELALRRVRAQLATRTGADAPLRVTDLRGTDLDGFLHGDASTNAVLWCTYPVQGTSGVALVALEGGLVSLLMGRLFGEGDTQPSLWQPRAPTGVEKAVSVRLCRELMDALADAWSGGNPPRFLDGKVAPSSRIAAGLDPTTPMLYITVEVANDQSPGRFFVALPSTLLVPSTGASDATPPAPTPRAPRFDRVFPVQVDLVVELARLNVSLGVLERLVPGDEIQLGSVGEVEARVGGKAAFVGQAGTTGGQRSFRIGRRANSDSSLTGTDR